jgi:hypothetical protein
MKKALLFSFALLFAMATMAQNRAMLLTESFDGNSIPTGWSVVGLGQSNWNISATTHAGGEANELWLYYGPQFNGLSRFVSPAIDLTGYNSVNFSFKHALDNYSGSHLLGIATTSDGGTTWNDAWTQNYNSDGSWMISQEITTPDMGHNNVQFCIFYQGNSYNIDNWYFDDIEIFTLENLDLSLSSIIIPDFFTSSDPNTLAVDVTVGMKVFNYGSTPVTSVEATYEIPGKTPVTETFNVNIPSLGNTTIEFATATALNPGGYEVNVSIDKVNGVDDDVLDNNNKTRAFSVAMATTDRIPMIEHFSSSTCSPCVSVNNQMNTFCNNNPGRFTYTKYQMNWPGNGDPYYTAEGGVRRVYYGVSAVPDMYLDGDGTNNSAVSQNTFNQHAEQSGFFDVRGSFNVTGNTINVKADVVPFVSVNARVYISVNEKVTHNNTGSNGETSFHHVMMKMLPDAEGSIVDFVGGETQHFEFTQDLSGTNVEEMSDLEVSIWVQDYPSHYVYNSHFAYEYTDNHPYPVENLAVVQDDQVNCYCFNATWDAPAQGNPVGYNVYVNNVLVAENITENTYSFEGEPNQFYTVGVVALYPDEQSSIKSVAGVLEGMTDAGLVAEEQNIVLDAANPSAELRLTNGNSASQASIELLSIEEVSEDGMQYLNITSASTPYSLHYGEEFVMLIEPIQAIGKGMVNTTIKVESDAGSVEFLIEIDENLLNVTEVTAATKLYPNPTNGVFTVEAGNLAKVEVYNLVGQKVYEVEGKKVSVDASNWDKGIYLVNIKNENGFVETRKLVVK